MLNNYSLTTKVFAIQLINSIICISQIIKLHKPISVLQIHLQDLPIALKEALHIALPGLVAQAADVHPWHPGNGGGYLARPQPPLGGGRRSESAATAAAAATELAQCLRSTTS